MHLLIYFTLLFLLFLLHIPTITATTDTILAGQALSVNDKLISDNSRYTLGFFETRGRKSSQGTTNWYLGIWFNTVPKITSAWIANRDKTIKNTTSLELTISHYGNLVILNWYTKSIIWSTQANTTTNSTSEVLLNSGNLILTNSSNSSKVLWESFDHPTDTLFPGAKLGWHEVTGQNHRLVSWKNLIDLAIGMYCDELDPTGVNQFLLTPLNSSTPYWSSGVWNGNYFSTIPEMAPSNNIIFVDNDLEKYMISNMTDGNMITRLLLDVSGQTKAFVWLDGSHDWTMAYAQPKSQCDVYAVCEPFTICSDIMVPHCNCMKGFNIKSLEDWEIEDQTGGCSRNIPLDCISNSSSITQTTDKFYSVPCVKLPQNSPKLEAAASSSQCGQIFLSNCSCIAYSFSNDMCSIWHELLNIRALQCSGITSSIGETLYLRVSAKDFHIFQNNRKGIFIGVVIGTCVSALGLCALILLLLYWKNNRKSSCRIGNGAEGFNVIIAFRYVDLHRAKNKFKRKLGGGSFGSVFKGIINESIVVAVKRLDGAYQGEKQFRAEVSSLGAIQHINLVKLVDFCCEGSERLLVYEYMSNSSLDVLLFRRNSTILNWTARYQIALGVARGLAYLHESYRNCIIHCDIKPKNILLDGSFIPKIADFGMAKILGRDFSRVLTTIRGTAGYLAPEWISGIAITPKVDVYSYGMVLLEIISSKRNSCAPCSSGGNLDVYIPVHAAHKLLEGDVRSIVDNTLHGDVNLNKAELACKVACWCIQDDELDRPTMGQVVHILEGLVEIRMPPIPRILQAISGSTYSEGNMPLSK